MAIIEYAIHFYAYYDFVDELQTKCIYSYTCSYLGETDMSAFRYLALGDSYTIGEKVSVKDRWPNQLAKLLEAEGIQTEVTILARRRTMARYSSQSASGKI